MGGVRLLISVSCVFVVAHVLARAPSAAPRAAVGPVLADAVRAVVAVNPQTQQFIRLGTAFHVGDGLFYTAAHIVKVPLPQGYTALYLAAASPAQPAPGWIGPAVCVCVHPQWAAPAHDLERAYPFDVAVLEVQGGDGIAGLTLSAARPRSGQRARLAGFPVASRAWPPILYTARGRVADVDRIYQHFRVEIDAGFALEGSSGSPVLDEDDRVIGVVYGREGDRGSGAASGMLAAGTGAIRTACR